MSNAVLVISAVIFTALIVASNYLVQFPINDFLTLGALTYPFTFLLADVLAEKYSKQEVLKVVRIGIVCAFVPSLFLSELRIAIASVSAFFVSQQLDVYAFFWIKSKLPKVWWLRSAGSTAFSQALDTIIFFHIAFLFVMPWQSVLMLVAGDYLMKFLFAFANTPLFYLFGIKMQKFLGVFAR
ncbi:queuosine precursor transporter [Helicobacter sp. MIT 05-5294]|uniref:queuosine precursor transporter n=1 Tax=Helicobacter sp. MIT 05-5294 TaxID=1548150 RepID=UPI00051F8875|nr:queuosine precursor transporter [Helicobacter sp. MIT 05-5294]TLD85971.1 VUT family protein [Helicobacter sp. MIT 05-5294]